MTSIQTRIANFAQIVEWYEEMFEVTNQKGVEYGLEWERIGVFTDDQSPVPYVGHRGYEKIINGLRDEFGWREIDVEDGHVFTLGGIGKCLITTEADGKPEISGAPYTNLICVLREIQKVSEQIDYFAVPMGISWQCIGISALHDHDQIVLAPKRRYLIWDEIFPEYHDWMHRYMKNLCGCHINLGVTSEADLIAKTQALYRLTPILTGIFANAPMEKAKLTPYKSVRRHYICTGGFGRDMMPKGMLDSDFTLKKWLDFFLANDIYIIHKGDQALVPKRELTHFNFYDFMAEGYSGSHAVLQDVDVHIKTHWVDIRPRMGYLEYRPLDSLPLRHFMASAAFVKGICSSEEAMQKVASLTSAWLEEDYYPTLDRIAYTDGALGEYKGVRFTDVLTELLPIAAQNLDHTSGEHCLLQPLQHLVTNRICPADEFMVAGPETAAQVPAQPVARSVRLCEKPSPCTCCVT